MDYRVSGESLTAVADAIRAKAGTTGAMEFPDGFVNEVLNMSSGEKWELLADITTTEKVNSFYVTTDTNGNAFKCKRIIAFALLPSIGPSSEFFGVGPSEWDDPYLMNNVNADAICRTYDITALTATAFLLESGYSSQQHFWADMEVTKTFRRASLNDPFLSSFLLTANNGDTYPTGTNLKVWGVKA